MDLSIKCNICSIESSDLVKIYESDANDIKWSCKLNSCVPEVEWHNQDYLLCQSCIAHLEIACAFRRLCLQSTSVRKKQWEEFLENEKTHTNGTNDETKLVVINEQDLNRGCSYCLKRNDTDTLEHGQKLSKADALICNFCNNISVAYSHESIEHKLFRKSKNFGQQCEIASTVDLSTDLWNSIKCEYICYHCNQSHSTKSLLISHISANHDKAEEKNNKNTSNLKKRLKHYKLMRSRISDRNESEMIEDNETMKKLELSDQETSHTEPISNDESVSEKETVKLIIKKPLKRGRKKLDQIGNTCHICGMSFNSRYLAKRHIRNVHATEKSYVCDICQQRFASLVYLNAHKRYHSRERPHICSFCGKGFITGSDLYHHEKIHANKRAYKCDKCPKAFNTSSDLHKHKLCVHEDRENWKYVCSYCNRRFPLKTNLDAHIKTHTGERNFGCHLCDRRCVNRSVLLRHIKSHCNVRLFKCNLCSTEYKYQKSLDIHMTKVHGIGNAKIPERVKKYFCHICPKSYFANNKLQKHIRTHTGERPFSCSMCEKCFIDKSYVKQHLKTAHNVIFNDTDII